MEFYKRSLRSDIQRAFSEFPAIFITGARQVGKSTLSMDLGISNYITLDDIATLQSAKSDPKGLIQYLQVPTIIDEIQRVPSLMLSIKEAIDRDRIPGRFILTGSSNLQGFKDLSDSLAGRIAIFELYPFHLAETHNAPDFNLIDFLFVNNLSYSEQFVTIDLPKEILSGGYPEIRKLNENKWIYLWFSSYISTYLERDARDLGEIRNLDGFMKLYNALAYRSGNITNKAELSKETSLDQKTLNHYLGVLTHTYQIKFLQPYFKNGLKRLYKSSKNFFLDSGILCHLLKLDSEEKLFSSTYKGLIFESFFFSELIKHETFAKTRVDIYYYRTIDGKEIDFLLDDGSSLVAIEVKSSLTVKLSDFNTIQHLIHQNVVNISKAIVFYEGDSILSFGSIQGVPLLAIPFSILGGNIRKY